jgi:hypothetical protein
VHHLRVSLALVLGAIAAVAGLGTVATATGAGAATAPAAATTSRHFIANLNGWAAPKAVGFNIFDTGAAKSTIDSLPRGVRAMVWLGQKCPTPINDTFRAQVRRLAGDAKVFGYYLSDEPHIKDCPGGPKALATRAAFIRNLTGGRQLSFIVLNQSSSDWDAGYRDYRAFRPHNSGVSIVGVDSYPCNHGSCDFSKITGKVAWAKLYIKASLIVPVYQAFGQANASGDRYYSMPTAAQERTILQTWKSVLPHPVMDYTYGWSHQDSANPTLVDSPALQGVLHTWFTG